MTLLTFCVRSWAAFAVRYAEKIPWYCFSFVTRGRHATLKSKTLRWKSTAELPITLGRSECNKVLCHISLSSLCCSRATLNCSHAQAVIRKGPERFIFHELFTYNSLWVSSFLLHGDLTQCKETQTSKQQISLKWHIALISEQQSTFLIFDKMLNLLPVP